MPTRIVREGIISSARINALSFGAEVLYRRIMSVADDYGRFFSAPGTIRGACWPTCPEKVQESDVEEWMEELSSGERPLVVLYEVNGCRYLQVSDFNQQTRSKSKFPAIDEGVLSKCLASDVQMLRTSRSRNSESETESETYTSARSVVEAIQETKPASPKSGSAKLGTRLNLTELPEEWARWAWDNCKFDGSRAKDEFDQFRDYWSGVPGSRGLKLDWFGTWRNRCRDQLKRVGVGVLKFSPGRTESATEKSIRVGYERMAKQGHL